MKPTFHQAFLDQLSPRTVMPAEACSELGFAPRERVRHVTWYARWRRLVRRWFIDRYPSVHG
jgi:hypothetical protein